MKYTLIGKLVNTHGLKGEVRILSDFKYKDRVFIPGMKIYIGKEKVCEVIETYRHHKIFEMITMKGYTDIDQVLKYKGDYVFVNKEDIKLNENEYLDEDIIGLNVYVNDKCLGKVRKIGSQKMTTIFILVVNFLKWVVVIGAIFMILSACGLRSEFSAAGAGIVALIIGLGSQSLVADILAGIFIVFEGDYQVGDIVILDGWRGEIQAIGVRTTKLIDAGGNIKIVNNSDIRSIINQTKELSIAKCYVSTKYEDRIENIEAVIADNIETIGKKIPAIVEGPFYKGVAELGANSVDLLFVAKCKESDIYQVQRDLNREIKILFDDNNIGIPFPQIVVHKGEDDVKQTVSKKTIKKAEEFTEEQHELSKDIDIKK